MKDLDCFALGRRLNEEVLTPLKSAFVGKDEIVDLLGVCLAGGENLFLLGPPGTAKSAIVHELSRRLDGKSFDYLLTRFTEPNELFGPFDIRRLREGELVTNTEGMLPESSLVFLDELLNANSAILNSLLMALNERIFRRGKETLALPVLCFIGASNHLPEEDALGALFDRFLLRAYCGNVPGEMLAEVLEAGWRLDGRGERDHSSLHVEEVRKLQHSLHAVNLLPARPPYLALIGQLRAAGMAISDRRAVKLQRVVAASALLCGRAVADPSDFWVLRHIWDREEQREMLADLVNRVVESDAATDDRHPAADAGGAPDPERIRADLDALERAIAAGLDGNATILRDRLRALESRVAWIANEEQRGFLQGMIQPLWAALETAGDPSASTPETAGTA